jgi:nucleotide-binding universal stress UspA family protein
MSNVPKRILCGIATESAQDDSVVICAADRHTARQAMGLAARVGAEIRFMHVVDWIDARAGASERDIIEIVAHELVEDWAELRREAGARMVSMSHELCRGKPPDELLSAAREWEADVITISPRREAVSGLGRVLHGSTATRVLKGATCPVWVVDSHAGEVEKVLALVDRSPASPGVVEAASMLADVYGAERHALCCLDYPGDIALHRLPRAREEIERYHREVRDEAFHDLEKLTAGDAAWKLTLGADWVVRQAPTLIADRGIDLVVLAGNSKPRLAGALIGTTAQRLLERIEASVWVVGH